MLLSSPQHLQNTIKPRKVNETFTWLWTNSQHPQGLRTETIWIGIQTCIIHSELKTTHPYHLCPFLLLPLLSTFFFFFFDNWRRQSASWRLQAKRQGALCGEFEFFLVSGAWFWSQGNESLPSLYGALSEKFSVSVEPDHLSLKFLHHLNIRVSWQSLVLPP